MERTRRALHGRRKGKPLSPHRQRLMDELLPGLALDPSRAAPREIGDLFLHPVSKIVMEIGFGGGEHLVAAAADRTGDGFIGVEPFVSGMGSALAAVDRLGLHNVRLYGDDAALLLDWLPHASLDEIDLLYPDPWPKRRHRKRRFVSPTNIDRLARCLKPGGVVRFATDIADYAAWTLVRMRAHRQFRWTARVADDWRRPFPGWTGTRYEEKAIAAGRKPVYLTFERVGDA